MTLASHIFSVSVLVEIIVRSSPIHKIAEGRILSISVVMPNFLSFRHWPDERGQYQLMNQSTFNRVFSPAVEVYARIAL
jgi:hypothetical protein